MAYYRIGRDTLGRAVIESSYEEPDTRGPNVISISRLRGRMCAIADDQPRPRPARRRKVQPADVLGFPSPSGDGPGAA